MGNIDPATQSYINILEKTNQQLSLWYNPYGIMVGILAVLIGLVAIFFAYILWRQGKEYRDAFKNFLEEQKKIADGELKKTISEAKAVLDEQYNLKLKDLKDLKGKAREDIEKELEKLKKARESLEKSSLNFGGVVTGNLYQNPLIATTYDPLMVSPGINLNYQKSPWLLNNLQTCSSCFNPNIPIGASYCPQCGTKI